MKSKELALKIKGYREAQGLSQKQVAQLFGYLSAQFVSNWECGKSTPPVASIKKLSRLFKIDPDPFFEDIVQAKKEIEEEKMRKKYRKSK